MENTFKANFWTIVEDDSYRSKNSVQSYLCPECVEQRTEQIAPMECWPDE